MISLEEAMERNKKSLLEIKEREKRYLARKRELEIVIKSIMICSFITIFSTNCVVLSGLYFVNQLIFIGVASMLGFMVGSIIDKCGLYLLSSAMISCLVAFCGLWTTVFIVISLGLATAANLVILFFTSTFLTIGLSVIAAIVGLLNNQFDDDTIMI